MAIHYRIVKGQLGSQSAALSVGAARVVDDQLAQRRSMTMARIGVAHRPRGEAVVAVRAVLRAEAHMLGGLGLPAVRQRGQLIENELRHALPVRRRGAGHAVASVLYSVARLTPRVKALQVKRRYPAVFAEYARECKLGNVQIGTMLPVPTNELTGPAWVINFPTKTHWRSPSRLSYMVASRRRCKWVRT